jgi:hypothetical protein
MATATQRTYKITNWAKYNESLVERGSITFWFDEDVVDAWDHANDGTKVGRPFVYSDVAIECLLALRELFRLPYRQTEGLGRSLARLMQVATSIPDFTSLAKRAARLEIALSHRRSHRAGRRRCRQHRPESVWRRRVEGAQTWRIEASHLAKTALGGQSRHA